MRIHRVYCKSLSGPNKQFDLDEPQSRHLIKALRIKENDVVEVFDGMGDVAKCIVIKLTNKLCSVERTEDIRSDTKSKAQLKAIIPIIKKNNFNFMLQKMSEIGVESFLVYKPDNIDQSVAKKDIFNFVEKSKEIVISVCKQCGNNFLPSITSYNSLESAIETLRDDQIFAFDTDASNYFTQEEISQHSSVTIVTGPESGFTKNELDVLESNEVDIRYLGKNILRSETAPIVVSAIIKNQFGKINK